MKRNFLPAGIAAIFVVVCALIVFCIAFGATHGTDAMASLIAAIAAGLPCVPFSKRKTQKPNYPRIEHLRIAGKYQGQRFSAEVGFSPLRLR